MTTGRLIKIVILAAWVGLMGWWWLESRTWPAPEKIDAAFLPDYTDNFGLYYGDQKIGWVYKTLMRQTDGTYQGGQGLTVKLLIAGQEIQVVSSVSSNMDRVLNLIDFQYLLQAGPLAMTARGTVEEGRLAVAVNLGQYDQAARQALDEFMNANPLLADYGHLFDFSPTVEGPAPDGPGLTPFIPPYLSYLGLETGRNYALQTLSPATRKLGVTNARLEAKATEYDAENGLDIEVYRLRLGTGQTGELLWIDRFGRTVREEAAGFRLTRVETPAEAQDDVVPLVPPPGLAALISPKQIEDIMNKINSVRPKPEASEPDNGGIETRD